MCGHPGKQSRAPIVRLGARQPLVQSRALPEEQKAGRGPSDGQPGDLVSSWSITTGRDFTKEKGGEALLDSNETPLPLLLHPGTQ